MIKVFLRFSWSICIYHFSGSALWSHHLFWSAFSVFVIRSEYGAIVECCPVNYLNAMNSAALNSKDLHEITQLKDTGLSLTIEAIQPMLLRRYLIIWHWLSLLDTSARKYKSKWEWVNPSIVSNWAGAKALLEAIFIDRGKGEDEFLKTHGGDN